MASNYPGSLDDDTTLPEPSPGNVITAAADFNRSDAIKELETKLGIGASNAASATAGAKLVADGSGSSTWQADTEYTVGASGAQYVTDGTADDVQIQAAIDAATAAGGGTVFIKEGTYNIAAKVNLKAQVRLIGEGVDKTIIKNSADLAGPNLEIDGRDDVAIEELTVDGNKGIVSFSANTNNGIEVDGTCNNLSFRNIKVYQTSSNGIHIRSTSTTNYVTMVNVETDDTGERGVYSFADNLQVFGGFFHDTDDHDGFQVESCQDVTIIGATCYNNNDNGFEIQVSCTDVLLQGCVSYDNGNSGIMVANGCERISIDHNTVRSNDGDGITSQDESSNRNTNIAVTGNLVYQNGTGNDDNGIQIQGTDNSRIIGNHVEESAKHGINLTNAVSKAIVKGNTSINNKAVNATIGDGIKLDVDCANCLVEGNQCFDTQGTKTQRYGIFVEGSGNTDNVVINNQVADNLTANISDSGTDTTILFNQGYNPMDAFQVESDGNVVIYEDNSNTGTTAPTLRVANDGTGDPMIQLHVPGSTRWTMGIDNSDSDVFKISNGALSTAEFSLTGSGTLTLTGDLEIEDSSDGVILESPDATRWRVKVDNSGNLTTTSL